MLYGYRIREEIKLKEGENSAKKLILIKGTYEMSVDYDSSDESEIVIKVLMFGPNMRVLEPQSVIDEIKKRVTRQKQLFEHLWL